MRAILSSKKNISRLHRATGTATIGRTTDTRYMYRTLNRRIMPDATAAAGTNVITVNTAVTATGKRHIAKSTIAEDAAIIKNAVYTSARRSTKSGHTKKTAKTRRNNRNC